MTRRRSSKAVFTLVLPFSSCAFLCSLSVAVPRNLAIEVLPEIYAHVTLRLATVGEISIPCRCA